MIDFTPTPEGADGVSRVVRGQEIRHAEENTTVDKQWLIPWEVRLGIIRDNIDPRAHEQVYWVRAPDPGAAAYFASSLWTKWEKIYWGFHPQAQYPDTMNAQYVDLIPEEEFMSRWKFAQRIKAPGEYEKVGPSKSPSGFTYWTEGRVKPGVYDLNGVRDRDEEVPEIIIP